MKSHLFLYRSYCCVCVFLVLFFLGCTEDDTEERLFSLEKFYADSSFLEIQGDLNDPHVIWGNVKTYLPAFERMKRYLYVKDNRLRWDVVSGAELNISENIYDYVVERWEGMNRQLEESGGTLELYNDYYRIAYENVDNSRILKDINQKGLPVLKIEAHKTNMSILFEISWRVYKFHYYRNLKDHIDIKNSDFRGDGIGGMRIDGTVGTGGGNYYGYFCCNACAFMDGFEKYACEFNNINTWNRIPGAELWYFQVENQQGLPLIALRNAENFDPERGQILKNGE